MSEPIQLQRAIAKAAAARVMPFRMVKALVKLGKLTPAEGRAVIETMLQLPVPENDMMARDACLSCDSVDARRPSISQSPSLEAGCPEKRNNRGAAPLLGSDRADP